MRGSSDSGGVGREGENYSGAKLVWRECQSLQFGRCFVDEIVQAMLLAINIYSRWQIKNQLCRYGLAQRVISLGEAGPTPLPLRTRHHRHHRSQRTRWSQNEKPPRSKEGGGFFEVMGLRLHCSKNHTCYNLFHQSKEGSRCSKTWRVIKVNHSYAIPNKDRATTTSLYVFWFIKQLIRQPIMFQATNYMSWIEDGNLAVNIRFVLLNIIPDIFVVGCSFSWCLFHFIIALCCIQNWSLCSSSNGIWKSLRTPNVHSAMRRLNEYFRPALSTQSE